jgi:hypothetical protein
VNEYHSYLVQSSYGGDIMDRFNAREDGIARWGFAVPDDEAIAKIAAAGPVLEVMAGSGYWSKLISEQFAKENLPHDVIAVDDYSWEGRVKLDFGKYHPVIKGDAVEYAGRESTRSLLMVWPYMDDTADKVLRAYKGQTVFIVTEGQGGCCGTDEMFDTLSEIYEHVEDVDIPQWEYIHDFMSIWRRK